jgi:hypothetical protein
VFHLHAWIALLLRQPPQPPEDTRIHSSLTWKVSAETSDIHKCVSVARRFATLTRIPCPVRQKGWPLTLFNRILNSASAFGLPTPGTAVARWCSRIRKWPDQRDEQAQEARNSRPHLVPCTLSVCAAGESACDCSEVTATTRTCCVDLKPTACPETTKQDWRKEGGRGGERAQSWEPGGGRGAGRLRARRGRG